jgi:GDP-mannose mannosyl hydrolase
VCRPAGPDISAASTPLPERADFLHVVRHAPLVAVDLVVMNARGEVLLGLRNNEPARGTWFVPGGVIRKGERIADAIARVGETELGVRVDPAGARFVGVFEHLYATNFAGAQGFGTHYVVLAHRVRLPEGARVRPDPQHGELRWWRVPDLLADPAVHPNTRAYFADGAVRA